MPNWILNKLYVQGDKREREAFREAARKTVKRTGTGELIESDLQFENFFPLPSMKQLRRIYTHDAGLWSADNNWREDNWGCKWDARVDAWLVRVTGSSHVYEFFTPYDPPFEFVRRVSCIYRMLVFSMHSVYADGGRGIAKFTCGNDVSALNRSEIRRSVERRSCLYRKYGF